MDFELNEEQRMVREVVRELATKEIAPRAALDDGRGRLPMDLVRRLGELGLLGMIMPEEHGGAGFDHLSYVLVLEELARVSPALAVTVSVNNSVGGMPIARFGTPEQRERYLRPIAEGRMLCGFALTEPGAGSDARGIETRAERRGDDFVLDGTKIWVTNGSECGVMVAMAVTGVAAGRKQISAFLVEPTFPGVSVHLMEGKLGLHASSTAEVVFSEARVPAANLLGAMGDGLKVALSSLEGGRIGIAAQSVGIGQACLDRALLYARQRHSFGRPLVEHEAIALKLAEMATRLEAARLLTYRAAWKRDRGEPSAREASMAKLAASEAANALAAEAIQIHGGYGFMEEQDVARFYRDARVTTIYEGTSEVQRMLIARSVLSGGAV
jgi:alkylation response protein AidB-like acyl-CoA dehydrogenase